MPNSSNPNPVAPGAAVIEQRSPAELTEATPRRARFAAAYEALLPKITTVSPSELRSVNVGMGPIVEGVLGRMPRLMGLRAQCSRDLVAWDQTPFEELEQCARAAAHAYAQHAAATTPRADLPVISAKAFTKRSDMVSDAKALAHHGLIDPNSLDALHGTQGYADVAMDLLTLASVFEAAWPQVEGKTVVTRETLDEAVELADQVLVAAGLKRQSGHEIAEVALRRDQAFTLLVNTYDAVRRAVIFLRWNEGDADEYAPSLYAGRTSRKAEAEVEAETPAAAAAETPSTAVGTTPGAVVAPTAGAAGNGSARTATAPTFQDPTSGSPFIA